MGRQGQMEISLLTVDPRNWKRLKEEEEEVFVVMQSCLKKQFHGIHSLQMVLSTLTPPTPAPTAVPALAEDNMKNQMVAHLTSMSGMNLIWSRK
jgi:hypothetical protein